MDNDSLVMQTQAVSIHYSITGQDEARVVYLERLPHGHFRKIWVALTMYI